MIGRGFVINFWLPSSNNSAQKKKLSVHLSRLWNSLLWSVISASLIEQLKRNCVLNIYCRQVMYVLQPNCVLCWVTNPPMSSCKPSSTCPTHFERRHQFCCPSSRHFVGFVVNHVQLCHSRCCFTHAIDSTPFVASPMQPFNHRRHLGNIFCYPQHKVFYSQELLSEGSFWRRSLHNRSLFIFNFW